MEHVTMLGEEMKRCERELNALHVEGLESELLGPSVLGAKARGMSAFEQMVRPPAFSRPAVFSQRSGRKSYAPSRAVDPRVVFSMDEEEEDEPEEYGGEDFEEESDSIQPVRQPSEAKPDFWKMIANSMDEAHIQSEDQLRKFIFDSVMSGSFGKMDPRLREKLDSLTNTVLKESLPFMNLLKTEPTSASMQLYGLAMIVIKEYNKLSGLRAHMRQDMLSFVQFYERTGQANVRRSNQQDPNRYLRFYDYYADVCDSASANHIMSVKMTLRASGVDIMRKMLLAATHLVELVVVLGVCQKLRM